MIAFFVMLIYIKSMIDDFYDSVMNDCDFYYVVSREHEIL